MREYYKKALLDDSPTMCSSKILMPHNFPDTHVQYLPLLLINPLPPRYLSN